MKKRLMYLSLLSIIMLLSLIAIVKADGTTAYWTRAYCKYNAGSGSVACDSGQSTNSNTASVNCDASTKCAEEGDVYCYAQADCEAGGTTESSPTTAFNINWDTDSADCTCKAGAGRWGVQFDAGLSPSCCGDDSNESYASGAKSCDGTTRCCNSSSYYSFNNACVPGCPSITSVYFLDMRGQSLTNPDYNDMVQLVAETTNAAGTTVNFTLKETGTNCFTQDFSAPVQDNKAVVTFRMPRCTASNGGTAQAEAFFDFAKTQKTTSSQITTNANESNMPPVLNITSPRLAAIIPLSQNINFLSSSYDVDDFMSTLWDFGDGATSPEWNTTHQYSSGGPKSNIKLTVTDDRGASNSTTLAILVDTPGVDDPPLAIISQPIKGTTYPGPNPLVTFVANLSIDDVTPFNMLNFSWEFDEGTPYLGKGDTGAVFSRIFSRGGKHDVRLVVSDEDPMTEANTDFYVESCKVPMRDGTTVYLVRGGCHQGRWFCADPNTNTWYDTTKEQCQGLDGVPDIGKKTSDPHDDCCPQGTFCQTAGGACVEAQVSCETTTTSTDCENNGCVWLDDRCIHPSTMSSCTDYGTNSTLCGIDPVGLGKPIGRGLGTEVCGRTFGDYIVPSTSCKCAFDTSDPSNPKCVFFYSTNSTAGGQEYIQCRKSFGLTSCTLGKQTLSWSVAVAPPEKAGEPSAQEQCSGGSRQISCGTAVERLPFFSISNLIIAAVIIAIIYVMVTLLSKKNVKRRAKIAKTKRKAKRR